MQWKLAGVALLALALGGCFDVTAKSDFRDDGTASVAIEVGVADQVAALASGIARENNQPDLMNDCDKPPPPPLVAGTRWIKGVKGRRGDMATCTSYFEVDDPLLAVQSINSRLAALGRSPTVELQDLSLTRLDENSYRLTGTLRAQAPSGPGHRKRPNLAQALFATSMVDRFVTVSISAQRIHNATGNLSDDRRTVTWRVPLITLLQPPQGYEQEIRADIVYRLTWFDRLRRLFGLD